MTFTELRKSILDSFFGNGSEKTRLRNMARKVLPSCYGIEEAFIQKQTNLLRLKKKKRKEREKEKEKNNQPYMEKKRVPSRLGTANCFQ